ncbi:SDR family NAD(P)-dependent oxidoreductase [Asaia bogorensis]|uniref:SDR family NAD(P)-dependent oxidoreductase n=1 Tax=Asaia bogorensis TaxID=91915 RepID=UPI00197BAFE4
MRRLENKTAVITGAARGIGLAIARHFRDEGCTVIMTDMDKEYGKNLPRRCHVVSYRSMCGTRLTGLRSKPFVPHLISL